MSVSKTASPQVKSTLELPSRGRRTRYTMSTETRQHEWTSSSANTNFSQGDYSSWTTTCSRTAL